MARIVQEATERHDLRTRWSATGILGHLSEQCGEVERAIELWQGVFGEGSDDATTANRLSMMLEKRKDFQRSASVIREALTRHLPANVEEQLRKRLIRCESKSGQSEVKRDVQAFSVRVNELPLELRFQARIKPALQSLEMVNGVLRCLCASKGVYSLIDMDPTTGAELNRVEGLPQITDLKFGPEGNAISWHRTARVGEGPTILRFLDRSCNVVSETTVPDAVSQVSGGDGTWFVGCRDGFLYAFGNDGATRWGWETPGSKESSASPYFRPCPYYVESAQGVVYVSSMNNVYAVSEQGSTLWHSVIPESREEFAARIPVGGAKSLDHAFRVLGLPLSAKQDEVRSVYRRLVKATHPDSNKGDPLASERFREVQSAYETVMSGSGSNDTDGIILTFSVVGPGPLVSFL
ncbi:MAG: DnaJ domain-containing protein, partial [Terriglobia bacterium]